MVQLETTMWASNVEFHWVPKIIGPLYSNLILVYAIYFNSLKLTVITSLSVGFVQTGFQYICQGLTV